eukprot:211128-Chlamydomonas_euryale.AAC.5
MWAELLRWQQRWREPLPGRQRPTTTPRRLRRCLLAMPHHNAVAAVATAAQTATACCKRRPGVAGSPVAGSPVAGVASSPLAGSPLAGSPAAGSPAADSFQEPRVLIVIFTRWYAGRLVGIGIAVGSAGAAAPNALVTADLAVVVAASGCMACTARVPHLHGQRHRLRAVAAALLVIAALMPRPASDVHYIKYAV